MINYVELPQRDAEMVDGTTVKRRAPSTPRQIIIMSKLIIFARNATVRTMPRQEYRKKIEQLFGKIDTDKDVCHIIARKNGGADHPDNYDFVRGRTWNRMTGHRFDDVNCFLVGKEACRKAVDISRTLGDYSGPGADELYTSGERAMKHVIRILSEKTR